MTPYPTPREKAGKTLTTTKQLERIQNHLQLNAACLFNGPTGPRHAALTSHPRRTHIAPIRWKLVNSKSSIVNGYPYPVPRGLLAPADKVLGRKAGLGGDN